MKKIRTPVIYNIAALFLLLFIGACGSSVKLPSKEESDKKIAVLKPELDSLINLIDQRTIQLPKGHDLISRTRMEAINTLLSKITERSLTDIRCDFFATRPLWKEDKSVLGISYTNYVDIDTGSLDIDLKKFRFNGSAKNIIDAEVEIEGSGSIRVSGKYTGISANATPQIHFYLNEPIQFKISAADSDYIQLSPVPKILTLKTKVSISLLGLNLPYYKEIPLQAVDIIKPVKVPSAIKSEIVFPIPASEYSGEKMKFVKRFLRFTKSSVGANDNVLEYRSNIQFEKE